MVVSLVLCTAALAVVGTIAGAPASASVEKPGADDAAQIQTFRLPNSHGAPLVPNADNYATRASTPGPLLVFLPATGAVPAQYREFLDTAASSGYHVLGLDYRNLGRSVTETCKADATCYTQIERNRFDGSDPSRFSHVDPANSVLGRLQEALHYLSGHDKAGDWGQYLNGSHIRWGQIVLAGHSQGGGESAFISHVHKVRGVLMFSSPVATFNGVSASWMGSPGATPPSRMYGFVNSNDLYRNRILGSWTKLDLTGDVPPTSALIPTGSHALVSTLAVGNGEQSHFSSVADSTPQTALGNPRYLPVWTWMLKQVR
jgi:pimeloyl-ACP methyl ester carboxylesterase